MPYYNLHETLFYLNALLFSNNNVLMKFGLTIGHSDTASITDTQKTPAYSYTHSTPPIPLRSHPTMADCVVNIQNNIAQASALLLDGKDCKNKDASMGDAYYIDTKIPCDAKTSDSQCIGQNVTIQIDNWENQFGCSSSCQKSQGLMQSMLNDMVSVNPFEMINGVMGKGNFVGTSCEASTVRVVQKYPLEKATIYEEKAACVPRKQNVCEPFVSILNDV